VDAGKEGAMAVRGGGCDGRSKHVGVRQGHVVEQMLHTVDSQGQSVALTRANVRQSLDTPLSAFLLGRSLPAESSTHETKSDWLVRVEEGEEPRHLARRLRAPAPIFLHGKLHLFGVWGLGFGVWGLGFGMWVLGFGMGFRD